MKNGQAGFPSRPHDGASMRIGGAEPFVTVAPIWGTQPTFFLRQFSAAVPFLAGNVLLGEFLADGDAILESIALMFNNDNFAHDSAIGLEVNGQGVPFPSQLLLTVTVGDGILNRFPLNLFLKKSDTLRIIALGWQGYENETFRTGAVLVRYWTL